MSYASDDQLLAISDSRLTCKLGCELVIEDLGVGNSNLSTSEVG